MTTKAEPNYAPVALPPGSFDVQKLAKGLETAATAAEDKRGEAIDKAVTSARDDESAEGFEQGARTDQKRVDYENKELGITERVLVHDPKSEAAQEAEEVAEELAEHEAENQGARSGTARSKKQGE